MMIFCSDLDNTLIYSYKHDIGEMKTCVEIYEGRPISFMTDCSFEWLKEVRRNVLFVPVTTRTQEQYGRIDLGIGVPEYALVCNGGVLLINGREDENWYRESLELIHDCRRELEKAGMYLENDENRCFEVRNIRELFLFTKSSRPCESVIQLKKMLNLSLVDVFSNGMKVYVVPGKLSKGMAVKRFREKIPMDTAAGQPKVIAAGDSEFDVSMLLEADFGIAPASLVERDFFAEAGNVTGAKAGNLFSEEVLKYVLEKADLHRRSEEG